MAHAVLGGAAGVVWLVLPGMTPGDDAPVTSKEPRQVVSATAVARNSALDSPWDSALDSPRDSAPDSPPDFIQSRTAEADGTSTTDLVLPLVAAGAVGAVAAYGYIRRVRRTRGRTTPGGVSGPPPVSTPPQSLAEPDAQACAALVRADDRLRVARAELGFARGLLGAAAVAPFTRALGEAEGELAAAFRMRQRYDEGVPAEEAARRHALAGMIGRCEEAGRRLDAVAEDFARLRDPERALPYAEARFRDLTGHTAAAQALLADLAERYAPTATSAVTGSVEQAKDRLLFATLRLNMARQELFSGHTEAASRPLHSAEAAVAQAAVFVEGVDRTAAELRDAEETVPAALTGAEAELSAARRHTVRADEPHPRLLNADAVLASVRQEVTSNRPYDPLSALRRIVRATAPLASGRAGVLPAAALSVARASSAAADDFVATHRGAVGATARTRLAEARRLLAEGAPGDLERADELALEASDLAERDVRLHGNPASPAPAGQPETDGSAGAVLGGILPGEAAAEEGGEHSAWGFGRL
ncbi:hypothetical protein [Streptomyces sp. DSM 15324]|uniref:hypothetical protein n=1 Tax=Streptomyces sp. DSM 15324 TaxID=1739111 RepID=UPI0018FEB73F|nr:hypothetical protein [Streptomyces sp. DSM 15324]